MSNSALIIWILSSDSKQMDHGKDSGSHTCGRKNVKKQVGKEYINSKGSQSLKGKWSKLPAMTAGINAVKKSGKRTEKLFLKTFGPFRTAVKMFSPVNLPKDKSSYCCIWNEAEGGRCGNTIASALLKVLDQFTQENPTINNIILWSDSCVAQKRNSLMSYALLSFTRAHPHIKILTQKYSEAGHSLVQEVDSVHSAIERHLARCEVFSPVTLIRQLLSFRCNPKLKILQMKHTDFRCFDDARSMNFQRVPYTCQTARLSVRQNELCFTPAVP
ncbi:hypothetical protein PoB_004354400 [Plakobranchus ocellatus]|uniref:Uncharacterized protein n=1 Tax=Plakobranchus ocellatus TaxID=259542 RepID=A0AAV4BFB6_9GAST|nr:hypothetical protein PoB_004354400 [Plakobranchus ocellatus]